MTGAEVAALLIVLNGVALVALVYWYVSAGGVKGMKDYFGWDPPVPVMAALLFAFFADAIFLLMALVSVIASWIS